jgi:hypothetical protein
MAGVGVQCGGGKVLKKSLLARTFIKCGEEEQTSVGISCIHLYNQKNSITQYAKQQETRDIN